VKNNKAKKKKPKEKERKESECNDKKKFSVLNIG
jgi:hypothetical protein